MPERQVVPDSEPTTLATWALGIVETLESAGLAREFILAKTGVEPQVFEQPNARLGLSQLGELWALAVDTLGDTAGLQVGRQFKMRNWHMLGLGLASSTSSQEWLDRLTTYRGLITDGLRLTLEHVEGGALALSLGFVVPVTLEATRVDCILQASFQMIMMLFGVDVRPLIRVELIRPQPVDVTPWQTALGDQLHWGCTTTRVLIQPALQNIVVSTTDPEWSQSQGSLLQQALAKLQTPTLEQRVCRLIRQQLPTGQTTLHDIARLLNMSPRSLQRKLDEMGAQFRTLLDRVRQEAALDGLHHGVSGVVLAAQLGFTEASNFHTAFKRWTGMTTHQYLEHLRSEAARQNKKAQRI